MSRNLKVDFTTALTTIEGKPLKEIVGVDSVKVSLLEAGVSQMLLDQAIGALRPFWGSGEEPKETVLTACRACANALQATDANTPGADRVDRMRLAIRLMDYKQPVEITERDKDMILKSVEKAYPNAVVYFRIHELFERAAAERDKLPTELATAGAGTAAAAA
jgi:hypothetical protein